MKKAIILILITLTLPSPLGGGGFLWAADKWSSQDISLEATWLILHMFDYSTTLDGAKQPDKYHELNPILGRHPTPDQVRFYFLSTALLHMGATHILPAKYRPYWQGITIGMSGACAMNNLSIGLKLAW